MGLGAMLSASQLYRRIGMTAVGIDVGKAALDVVFRPDPHFLGPRETGVAEALASAR